MVVIFESFLIMELDILANFFRRSAYVHGFVHIASYTPPLTSFVQCVGLQIILFQVVIIVMQVLIPIFHIWVPSKWWDIFWWRLIFFNMDNWQEISPYLFMLQCAAQLYLRPSPHIIVRNSLKKNTPRWSSGKSQGSTRGEVVGPSLLGHWERKMDRGSWVVKSRVALRLERGINR